MIRTIPNFPNYLIDELGNVYNFKTDKFLKGYKHHGNVIYITLTNKGAHKTFQLAKLVLSVFQPSQTKINTYALHTDLELQNCANFNLQRGSRGDRKRMFNEIRAKVRGVYAYPHGKKKWRAVIKTPEGKTKTLGYFKHKYAAQHVFNIQYKEYYGKLPY